MRKFVFILLLCFPFKLLKAQSIGVAEVEMKQVYEAVKTPYKFGLVMVSDDHSKKMDCPTIFRKGKKWYMTYLIFDGRGYETWLSSSHDLLNWKSEGKVMSFTNDDHWDANQKAGYNALVDIKWGGNYRLKKYKSRYWMSYFGGKEKGYEVEPLSIGMAFTKKKPTIAHEWDRYEKPVLSALDADVRWWENRNKLFKSSIIEDEDRFTGYRFVMYYNAVGDSLKNNKKTRWYERIGMAVSNDMINWKRFEKEPVMHHPVGITGDAVIQKMGDKYLMFYYGAFWQGKNGAFNRFAVSKDLIHWTDWQGEDLINSSEDYDALYAHKSYVINYHGTVYHFYCAVNKNDQRGIALATSKELGKSKINFIPIIKASN
jgi:predicted GH43/DUF377 family glycosyl hydrolase